MEIQRPSLDPKAALLVVCRSMLERPSDPGRRWPRSQRTNGPARQLRCTGKVKLEPRGTGR